MLYMLIIIINNAADATLAVPDSDVPEALTDDRPWRVAFGRMLADAAMRCEPTGLSRRLSRAGNGDKSLSWWRWRPAAGERLISRLVPLRYRRVGSLDCGAASVQRLRSEPSRERMDSLASGVSVVFFGAGSAAGSLEGAIVGVPMLLSAARQVSSAKGLSGE